MDDGFEGLTPGVLGERKERERLENPGFLMGRVERDGDDRRRREI